MLMALGGIIGWAGSLRHGLRLVIIAYAACVVAFQHMSLTQALLSHFFQPAWLSPEIVISGLAFGTFIVWEVAYGVMWRPALAKGGVWRRTGGMMFGLVAGWVMGTVFFNGLYALRVVNDADLFTQPAYANMISDTMRLVYDAVTPLLP